VNIKGTILSAALRVSQLTDVYDNQSVFWLVISILMYIIFHVLWLLQCLASPVSVHGMRGNKYFLDNVFVCIVG